MKTQNQTYEDQSLSPEISVYYDGLCQLCSREINHYKTMSGAHRISFVDITSAEFAAEAEGLDPVKIHESLHVKDSEGNLFIGVDAFVKIWAQLDSLKMLVPVASCGPIKKIMEAGYFVFAKIRPLLPRKSCADSPYCEVSPKRV